MSMKRIIFSVTALFWAVMLYGAAPVDSLVMKPKPVYGKEAKVVSYILDNNHYRKIQLNDSLSSAILDSYLKSLDNNKSYFLASDVQSFEKFRFAIDDLTRKEDVSAAYEIYNVFAKRTRERMDYVLTKLIGSTFDYTTDEYYETEREKQPWARTPAELDEIWRKIIKSQALSLRL